MNLKLDSMVLCPVECPRMFEIMKNVMAKNSNRGHGRFSQMLCRRRIHIFELMFRALELMESTPSNDVNSAKGNAPISHSLSSVSLCLGILYGLQQKPYII